MQRNVINNVLIISGTAAERAALAANIAGKGTEFWETDGTSDKYRSNGTSWLIFESNGAAVVSIAGSSGTGGVLPVTTSGWTPQAGVTQLPRLLLNIPVYAGHATGAAVNSGTEIASIDIGTGKNVTAALLSFTTRGSNVALFMTVNPSDDADAATRLRTLVGSDSNRYKIIPGVPRFIPFDPASLGVDGEIQKLTFTAIDGTAANELDVEFF